MSTIVISRAVHDKDHPFALISAAVARALPVEDLGLLVKLLIFRDGWEVDRDRLQRDFAVTPGETKRLLPSLVERGHLGYEKPRDPLTGKYTGETVWKVSELPIKAGDVHKVEIDHVDNQQVENQQVDFHHVDNDEVENQRVDFEGDHGTRARSRIPDSFIPKDSDIGELESLHASAHEREISSAPLHRYLLEFVDRLGHPNGHAARIENEITRLGDDETRSVLLGCGNAGSWQYILTALERRKTSTAPPSSAPPPSDDLPALQPMTFLPLGGVWATICATIPDPAVRRALTFDATITEPNVNIIRIEPGNYAGDPMAAPGVQDAIDIMRDMEISVEICSPPVVRWLDRQPERLKNIFRVVHEALDEMPTDPGDDELPDFGAPAKLRGVGD